jgi:hypothetical protein
LSLIGMACGAATAARFELRRDGELAGGSESEPHLRAAEVLSGEALAFAPQPENVQRAAAAAGYSCNEAVGRYLMLTPAGRRRWAETGPSAAALVLSLNGIAGGESCNTSSPCAPARSRRTLTPLSLSLSLSGKQHLRAPHRHRLARAHQLCTPTARRCARFRATPSPLARSSLSRQRKRRQAARERGQVRRGPLRRR